jgi:hypothetical protein
MALNSTNRPVDRSGVPASTGRRGRANDGSKPIAPSNGPDADHAVTITSLARNAPTSRPSTKMPSVVVSSTATTSTSRAIAGSRRPPPSTNRTANANTTNAPAGSTTSAGATLAPSMNRSWMTKTHNRRKHASATTMASRASMRPGRAFDRASNASATASSGYGTASRRSGTSAVIVTSSSKR